MKHKSMVRQVQKALQNQLRIGESRHDAKKAEATENSSDGGRVKEWWLVPSCYR